MSARRITVILTTCFVISILSFSSTTWAASWYASRDTRIQYGSYCTYIVTGPGLSITENLGTSNWIHMAIPSPYGAGQTGAQFFRLYVYLGSADIGISQIDVYNGPNKVKTLNVAVKGPGWKYQQFDLGAKMPFLYGMGLSIKINAGTVSTASHNVIFSSASALFN
jgi:hypothetical protein